jgi:hypothetical protein
MMNKGVRRVDGCIDDTRVMVKIRSINLWDRDWGTKRV